MSKKNYPMLNLKTYPMTQQNTLSQTIRTYYSLTKPGIVYGNLFAAAAGFFVASKGHPNLWLLLATLLGTALIIGSACVVNNYTDRKIDQKMSRTKNRALAKGTISAKTAIIYALILGLLGFYILAFYVNLLTVFIGIIGFLDYVVFYALSKRASPEGTLIGSISGATPPIAGYCAVTNQFDTGALLLFLILLIWQMPHFYAIALYRSQDYAAAAIPVLPLKKGIQNTKIQMLLYILAFGIVSSLLSLFGFTGKIYFIVSLILSLIWLVLAAQGFRTQNDTQWARRMFTFSLIILTTLCIIMSINTQG